MALVTFNDVGLEFGDQRIFRHAEFAVGARERVCLIGRNGAGKSTLLRLIIGALEPDSGDIRLRGGIQISQLEQVLPRSSDANVHEFVSGGLEAHRRLIREYHELSARDLDDRGLSALEALQRNIEAHGGWDVDTQTNRIMSELELPAERRLGDLSGGWQRRVGLARALVGCPDLLLLDEPTNHLDLNTINWLEHTVSTFPGSVLFITHDRAFLQRLATRIVEIDRGRLRSWPGSYHRYLDAKDKALQSEARHNAVFDKKLAEEEIWIRQGLKARRKRNEGRVRALLAMRETQAQRIKPDGTPRIAVQAAEQSSRRVVQAQNVSFDFGETPLIARFSLKIMRGDRIGLIGNNGVGKSTLLRLLLGEIQPQTGTVKHGENLEVGYFDQLRRRLDGKKTVAEIVGDGRDYITINGKQRHVIGYLRGFLFTAKRAMTPVGYLSGGECNRVILAKLFTRPSNLLILDEPTSDLDVETLEVLEAQLADFPGTLIVVSHDREFLDNVVTSTLVFEDDGSIKHYPGGYSDWLRKGKALAAHDDPLAPTGGAASPAAPRTTRAPNKLSYKLQRELASLPDRIEALEAAIEALQHTATAADFYQQPYTDVQPVLAALDHKNAELERAVERWGELEALADSFRPGLLP